MLNNYSVISKPVSQQITELLATHDNNTLTLDNLLRSMDQHGFGLLLVISALPVLIPLPPGLGAIPGLLIIFWSLQRLFRRQVPWIPARLGRLRLNPKFIGLITAKALPALSRLETRLGLKSFQHAPSEWEQKATCVVLTFMGLLILLPTPFLNTIPALIVMLLGLALINQNRRLLWISNILGIIMLGIIYSGISLGAELIIEELDELSQEFFQS